MATVRIQKNILEETVDTFTIDEELTIESLIREHTDGDVYDGVLVECYDAETGKTFFAPIEEDSTSLNAIVQVNGKDASLDYKVQKDDIVGIVITPASGGGGGGGIKWGWSWEAAWAGLASGALLGGFWGGGAFSWLGAGIGAVIGFFSGGLVVGTLKETIAEQMKAKDITSKSGIDSQRLPDVRGATNQPLLDQSYPFVIGKHLVTPFIIGSPWNEISGNRGQTNYIHVLYAVGYAPLRLTDFKLGDMFLAHNQRWADNKDMRNIFHGALTGIDHGDNNKGIDYYQANTTIDLRNRPLVDAATMRAAGWSEVEDGEIATVYSSAFSNQQETKTVLVTPILSDGTVLTPSQLESDAEALLNGTSISHNILLNTFNGADSIEQSEKYAEGLHNSQATYYGLNGDIVNTWSNNDITLEILQQGQNGEEVDYGTVYPYAKIQSDINANALYIADGSLEEIDSGNSITYKGLGLKNGLRNNPIRYTEEYAKSAKIELDFQSGLYKSRSETDNNNNTSEQKYYKIPMWVALQWRVFSEENDETDGSVSGELPLPNYDPITKTYDSAKRGWNSFEVVNDNLSVSLYTEQARYDDIKAHTGNKLRNVGPSQTIIEHKGTYRFEFRPPIQNRRIDIARQLILENINNWQFLSGEDVRSSVSSVNDIVNMNYHYTWIHYNDDEPSIDYVTFDVIEKEIHSTSVYDADINNGWLNANVFNLESLGGTNTEKEGINEIRCIANLDFVEWARYSLLTQEERESSSAEQILAEKFKAYFYDGSNTTRSIEVRVVRVSPCYLDETVSSKDKSAFKFNDVFTWSTLTSEMLDGDKLTKQNQIVQKRPLPDECMRKLCVVSLKAKSDNVDQLTNTIKKFSCIAQSFAPYYDSENRQWVPERVTKTRKYFRPPVKVDKNGNRGEAAVVPPFTWEPGEEITEQQFYEDRQNGTKSVCYPSGNDYVKQMMNIIKTNSHKDSKDRYFIPYDDKEGNTYKPDCDGTLNFCTNLTSSMFILAGIGPHLGIDALGYEQKFYDEETGEPKSDIGDFDLSAFGKWNEEVKCVKDGSYYTSDGYHYNIRGERIHHVAKEEVEMFFAANAYVYQPEQLESIFSKIAMAGRAVYTRDSKGRITVIMDKPEQYPVALINQQNTLKSSYTISFEELPSGLQITFPDENDGYQQNNFYCMRDGEDADNPHGAIEPYQFAYVTNNYQQNSLGNYLLANRILNREVVTKQLGIEGASIGLGNLVLVSDDTMLIGTDTGARITQLLEDDERIYGFLINNTYKYTGETEEVDSVVKCKQGVMIMQPSQYKEYKVITLRLADTSKAVTLNNVTYQLVKGNTNVVLFDVAIVKTRDAEDGDFYYYKPEVENLVSFGIVDKITATYRVIKIKGNNNHTFDFTLSKYQEDLYTAGRALPSFQNNMTEINRSDEDSFALSESATQMDVLGEVSRFQSATTAQIAHLYANHIVTLYKESEQPITETGITGTCTYSFATNEISWEGSNNGWSLAKPITDNPVYVTSATAFGKEETDDILPNEWAVPIQLGLNGSNGINTCTINLYKRLSATPSSYPETLTYNFLTGSLIGEKNGWQESIPDIDENENAPCWEIHATAQSATNTATIEASNWTSPAKITQDGYSKEEIMSWIEDVQIESPNIYVTPNTGIFTVDDDGIVQADQNLLINVKVIQTNEEIDFSFGAIQVPEGFEITVNGQSLILTAREGTRIKNAYFNIPIVFRKYEDNTYYVDAEENPYVSLNCQDGKWYGEINSVSNLPAQEYNNYFLWTGTETTSTEEVVEGGVFKENVYYYSNGTHFKEATYVPYGMQIRATSEETFNSTFAISTIEGGRYFESVDDVANIPTDVVIGDYFAWTGADQTSSTIVQGGVLFAGCVYKWNGAEWVKDTSAKHRTSAMKELMSVAENKLAQNNSDVIEYIRELITMNVVTENIQVTGEALINSAITAQLTLAPKENGDPAWIRSWNFSTQQNKGFSFDTDGKLIANEAIIRGNITATSLTLESGVTIPTSKIDGIDNYATKSQTSQVTKGNSKTVNGITYTTYTVTPANGDTSYSYEVAETGDDNEHGFISVANKIGSGSTSQQTAPFFTVSKEGLLQANNAWIRGTVYATNGVFQGDVVANSFTLAQGTSIELGTNTGDNHYFGLESDGTLTVRNINAVSGNFLGDVTAYKNENLTEGDLAVSIGKNPKNKSDSDVNFIIQSYITTLNKNKYNITQIEQWKKEFYTSYNSEEKETDLIVNGKINSFSGFETFQNVYCGAELESQAYSAPDTLILDNNTDASFYSSVLIDNCIYLIRSYLAPEFSQEKVVVYKAELPENNKSYTLNFVKEYEQSELSLYLDNAVYYKGKIYIVSNTRLSAGVYVYDPFATTKSFQPVLDYTIKNLILFEDKMLFSRKNQLYLFDGTNVTPTYISGDLVCNFSDKSYAVFYEDSEIRFYDSSLTLGEEIGYIDYSNSEVYDNNTYLGTVSDLIDVTGRYSAYGKLFLSGRGKTSFLKNYLLTSLDCGKTWFVSYYYERPGSATESTLVPDVVFYYGYASNGLILLIGYRSFVYSIDNGKTFKAFLVSYGTNGNPMGNCVVYKADYYKDIIIPRAKIVSGTTKSTLAFEKIRSINLSKIKDIL